jgi:hypothetical protein
MTLNPISLSHNASHPPAGSTAWAKLAETVRTHPDFNPAEQLPSATGRMVGWLEWAVNRLSNAHHKVFSYGVPRHANGGPRALEALVVALLERGAHPSHPEEAARFAGLALEAGCEQAFTALMAHSTPTHHATIQALLLKTGEGKPDLSSRPEIDNTPFHQPLWLRLLAQGQTKILTILQGWGWLDVNLTDLRGNPASCWVRHVETLDWLNAQGFDWSRPSCKGRLAPQVWLDQVQQVSTVKALLKAWTKVQDPRLPSHAEQAQTLLCTRLPLLPPALCKQLLKTAGIIRTDADTELRGRPLVCWAFDAWRTRPTETPLMELWALPSYSTYLGESTTQSEFIFQSSAMNISHPEEAGCSLAFAAALDPLFGRRTPHSRSEQWVKAPESRLPMPEQWAKLEAWMTHRTLTATQRERAMRSWWTSATVRQESSSNTPTTPAPGLAEWLITPDPATGAAPLTECRDHPWHALIRHYWRDIPRNDGPLRADEGQPPATLRRAALLDILRLSPDSPGADLWMGVMLMDRMHHLAREYHRITPAGLPLAQRPGMESRHAQAETLFLEACWQKNLTPHPVLKTWMEEANMATGPWRTDNGQPRVPTPAALLLQSRWEAWQLHWALDETRSHPASPSRARLRV